MAEGYEGPDVVRILTFQKLVLDGGFFELVIFEINGGKPLPGELEIVFELETILIKLDGLRLLCESFVTIAEGVKRHSIVRLAEINGIQLFDCVLQTAH